MPSACAGNIRKHVLGIFRYPAVDPKTLSDSVSLSTALDESPPPFQRPIYYTRRKPAEPEKAYPPVDPKALRHFSNLSTTPDESPPQFL